MNGYPAAWKLSRRYIFHKALDSVGIHGVGLAIDQVTLSDLLSPIKRGGYNGYIF
ncbi:MULTISPECIES: hypothetical protein [unclassified Microcoleus]|uniref:hypothetical protein n=1 Tax=unclassified Microcoleus TaxID=2642155 RepID=UPI002FD337F3